MFDFEITPDGSEPFQVTAGSRDILVWERTNKGASIGNLLAERRMGDLYKLAYLAAKREGQFTGTPQEFEESCEIGFSDADEEPNPTQPAP